MVDTHVYTVSFIADDSLVLGTLAINISIYHAINQPVFKEQGREIWHILNEAVGRIAPSEEVELIKEVGWRVVCSYLRVGRHCRFHHQR